MRLKKQINADYEEAMKVNHDFNSISSSLDISGTSKKKSKHLMIISASLAGVLVIGGIVGVSLVLSNRSSLSGILVNDGKYLLNKEVTHFQQDDASLNNIAIASLDFLDDYLLEEGNSVVSPASLALANGGLLTVSSQVEQLAELTGFEVERVQNQLVDLLNALNWEMIREGDKYYVSQENSYIKSLVLIQNVGDVLVFDNDKVKSFEDTYIQFAKSKGSTAASDVQKILKERIGLTIDVPFKNESDDYYGININGALTLVDSVDNPLGTSDQPFTLKDGTTIDVPTTSLYEREDYLYYEGANYTAVRQQIEYTSLLFVLPNEGYELSDINLTDAYKDIMENGKYYGVNGYIPYFSVEKSQDLTSDYYKLLTLDEKLCDKVLKDNPINDDLVVSAVLQNSKFEFNKYGVKGESITTIQAAGDAAEDPEKEIKTFECNRPFYAISIYDNFPLFAMKIDNPLL